MPKNEVPFSPKEKVDFAVHNDRHITRDTLREWLEDDLKRVHVFVRDVLSTKELLDVYADLLYERYQEFHKAKEAAPELPMQHD